MIKKQMKFRKLDKKDGSVLFRAAVVRRAGGNSAQWKQGTFCPPHSIVSLFSRKVSSPTTSRLSL